MSTKIILIPPSKKAIITNNGSSNIKIWKGNSTDSYNILKAGDSDQVFNDSNTKELEVHIENYKYSSVEIVDFDDC